MHLQEINDVRSTYFMSIICKPASTLIFIWEKDIKIIINDAITVFGLIVMSGLKLNGKVGKKNDKSIFLPVIPLVGRLILREY